MDRALIVQKFWLDKILDEVDPKLWEMRTTNPKVRGTVGLIEAGSGLIVGSVEIVLSFKPTLQHRTFVDFHKIEDLSLLDKWPYAWVLNNAKRFEEPIPYKHPKGAVIWVKI